MISKPSHVDRVLATTASASAAAMSRLAASWARSLRQHGLDPGDARAPGRVAAGDLAHRVDAMGALHRIATGRVEDLFDLVARSGCGVLLTDASGVIVGQRCLPGDAGPFGQWGLWQGADWSEASQGTNGVGTCLTENRPLVVHREEHFYARNTGISCMDAPIYAPDGSLAGALNISSARDDHTVADNKLLAALVARTAGQIEADAFRMQYPGARILVADPNDRDGNALLAVDGDDLVIGANRAARRQYRLGVGCPVKPCPASDLVGRTSDQSGLHKAERTALIQELVRVDNNVSEAARRLGIGRATLYRRMKRLKIGPARREAAGRAI